MKCERCQNNPARVRIDQIVDGHREQHYLCQQCVDELMSAAMGQMGGSADQGMPNMNAGAPFGFGPNNSASASGGVNTATANAQGVATAPVFTANATAGSYTVMASAPRLWDRWSPERFRRKGSSPSRTSMSGCRSVLSELPVRKRPRMVTWRD